MKQITNQLRQQVSLKKNRWTKDGFDLDLSYILEGRVLAMGFPSEGMEGVYRNPLPEVLRFLDFYHPHKYLVYNLCGERGYVPLKFGNQVRHFPFNDHNAPPLYLLSEFCYSLDTWLKVDPKNVAAIHCKAGKGRTGLVICCYLLHCGQCGTAEEAMEYYGSRRTADGKGVTIPSQIRYIQYYEKTLAMTSPLVSPKLWIRGVLIHTIPSGKKEVTILLERSDGSLIYKSKPHKIRKNAQAINCDFHQPVKVRYDVKVTAIAGKSVLFSFWFNTAFVSDNLLSLEKKELDKACRDKKKVFSKDLKVEVYFLGKKEYLELKKSVAGKASKATEEEEEDEFTSNGDEEEEEDDDDDDEEEDEDDDDDDVDEDVAARAMYSQKLRRAKKEQQKLKQKQKGKEKSSKENGSSGKDKGSSSKAKTSSSASSKNSSSSDRKVHSDTETNGKKSHKKDASQDTDDKYHRAEPNRKVSNGNKGFLGRNARSRSKKDVNAAEPSDEDKDGSSSPGPVHKGSVGSNKKKGPTVPARKKAGKDSGDVSSEEDGWRM